MGWNRYRSVLHVTEMRDDGSTLSGENAKHYPRIVVYIGLLCLILAWTNPPDADLAAIRFYAVEQGKPDTLFLGEYPTVDSTGYRRNGLQDQIHVNLGCRSNPSTWFLWATSVDDSGNVSPKSNVLQLLLARLP